MRTYERIMNHLSILKLNEMKEYLSDVEQFITKNQLSFYDGLLKLTDYQIEKKVKNM